MARGIITGTLFRNQELDYTSLKDMSVQSRPAPGEAGPPNLYEQVSAASSNLKGEIHHALPAHRTLLRVVDLPSDDPEEIEGMVDLKMEQIAPFPVDHMQVSHEILHQSDSSSRVLIVAAQKKWVTHAGDSFQEAGLDITRVDVDILGWLHLLRTAGNLPERGRHLLLFMDATGSELVLVEDGVALGFRSLGLLDEEETEAEFMNDLVEELDYSLTSLEGEWGGEPMQSLTVWHRGGAPNGINRLGEVAGVPLRRESLETLGPISEGIALRAASADKAKHVIADLAPEEWGERIKDASAKRGLYMAALAMLSLFLLYLMGVILFTRYQTGELENITTRANALKGPSDEVTEMQKNYDFLEGFTNRDQSALETLKRMTDLMPAGINVRSMRFDKKSESEVVIKANTSNPTLINQWVEKLTDSGAFIIPGDSTRRQKARSGGWDFNFEAELNAEGKGEDDGSAELSTKGSDDV